MRFVLVYAIGVSAWQALAQPDPIGLAALKRFAPDLTGCGVHVAQAEASSPGWQANPVAVGVTECQMVWTCGGGSATNFPNSLGSESDHANEVSRLFFSVAPGATRLDNYEASYFIDHIIPNQVPISARIVNQSFAYFARITHIDQQYDNYAAKHHVLFVSGAGNAGWVGSPGTAYNGISVGAFGGSSCVGPATDGRCKPDITAPAGMTSFSTPLVSGAAAVLMQAGATDMRLVKALLLNGALKPADWTNRPTAPLDPRYGAGIVNVFNSWRQFRGGQHAGPVVRSRRGWDIATIASNEVRQYLMDVPSSTITATLVWLRNYGCTNIVNLNLKLRSEAGDMVAASTSVLDNVEHLHLPSLPSGRYVIEVSSDAAETYALVFDSGPSSPPRMTPWALSGEPNQRYVIESSFDLRTWSSYVTNQTTEAGEFAFNPTFDAGARFFRAIESP